MMRGTNGHHGKCTSCWHRRPSRWLRDVVFYWLTVALIPSVSQSTSTSNQSWVNELLGAPLDHKVSGGAFDIWRVTLVLQGRFRSCICQVEVASSAHCFFHLGHPSGRHLRQMHVSQEPEQVQVFSKVQQDFVDWPKAVSVVDCGDIVGVPP